MLVSTVNDAALVRGPNLFNKVEISILELVIELRLRVVWLLCYQERVLNNLRQMSSTVSKAICVHLIYISFEEVA